MNVTADIISDCGAQMNAAEIGVEMGNKK